MSWILGRQSMTFHSAKVPVRLPLKRGGDDSPEVDSKSLSDLCKDATPACWLNPLLFNGHLQTLWTAINSSDVPITYQRKVFSSDSTRYPGTFAVDFVVPTLIPARKADASLPPRTTYFEDTAFDSLASDDDKPMLIVLHGLAGGSNEIYLRSVLKLLCLDPPVDERWEACVVNARGCAMSKITSGLLYNARATWDIRQFVQWARQMWPRRRIFACGFSLGANILVNYLGEEEAGCPLDAAIVISNPWNLEVSSFFLQSTWLGMNVYMRAMGTSMRQLWARHKEDILREIKGIDVEKVDNMQYLFEFDRYVQCPTWGWPTVRIASLT
ncbi:hypothetical protein, variant 1 [Verruconis gallopava]|uniref:AB hydrolase-1 domain-containing protein n=1 Tax=Verruconis gallopava TaxID=253628 RepID=A0A0D2AJ90_9PEZI|nr:hypothetical protein, variant 1 [Verruconis gallopava]KIV98978.1 hypothetical protein, variant 1 [Verruconis gallopava]